MTNLVDRQDRFSSAIVEEDRQLPQRLATGSGQQDLARRIIELEALERHSGQFALEAVEVAYAQDGVDRPVIAAEYEVVDVADDLALVVDDRPQLEVIGAVAFGDFLGVGCDQGDLLGRNGGGVSAMSTPARARAELERVRMRLMSSSLRAD